MCEGVICGVSESEPTDIRIYHAGDQLDEKFCERGSGDGGDGESRISSWIRIYQTAGGASQKQHHQ